MLKNALTRLFDYESNQASRICDDFTRYEKRDEDGNVFSVFEKVDYPKHQSSLGSVTDWSLDSLMKAGISPDFPIRTGSNTRLEVASAVESFSVEADKILSESDSKI